MRTLHVSQPVSGGTAAVVEQCASDDLDDGLDVAIASPPGRLEQWAAERGVPWHRLDLTRQPGIGDLGAARSLRSLLSSCDVALLHSSKAGAVGRLALATLPAEGRPRCIFYPHAWSWYVGGRMAPVYRQVEGVLSRWTDAMVVVSQAEAIDGRDVLPVRSHGKIRLIENGVDIGRFTPEGERAPHGARLQVLCVGRLSEQKGQDVLLEAFGELEDLDAELLLLGDGPDRDALEAAAARLGDRVRFLGEADPRPYYRAADVVVLPSRWEGLSLVLLEAMACGAPIVATTAASAGLGEQEGVVPVGTLDAGRLAGALRVILTDAGIRHQAGQRAREVATVRFSSTRVSAEYRALLASLVPLATSRPSAVG